jgi:hypothetical protein
MIKTFRGLLLDNQQEKIRLSTKKGKIGYRIIKFQIIGIDPATSGQESTVKIFKIKQTSVTGAMDFSDGNLLAAAFLSGHDVTPNYPEDVAVIFDQEVFNQDIYITHFEANADIACNYYLELEVMNLSDNQAAVSTLRDIRLNPQVGA